MRINHRRLATGFAPLLLGVLVAPAAPAAVPLGGGAGIVVEGSYCTLTTIGHDRAGDLVGFTAGHCGGPGAPVSPEGQDGNVGSVVAAGGGLDYSVIRFEADKVTPVDNFAGFAIRGIGEDPEWHQPECKFGGATGDFCASNTTLPGPGPRMSIRGAFLPGDDGGPVTSDELLVGMITGGAGPFPPIVGQPPVEFIHVIKFSRVLDDVNANGGPGSGFVPIP